MTPAYVIAPFRDRSSTQRDFRRMRLKAWIEGGCPVVLGSPFLLFGLFAALFQKPIPAIVGAIVGAISVAAWYSSYLLQKSIREEAQAATRSALALLNGLQATDQNIRRSIADSIEAVSNARSEFTQLAYGPFWQEIERAIKDLDVARRNIEQLPKLLDRYRRVLRGREHDFPATPIDTSTYPDLSVLITAVKRVSRDGLTNRDFAVIGELRRVHHMLGNLG